MMGSLEFILFEETFLKLFSKTTSNWRSSIKGLLYLKCNRWVDGFKCPHFQFLNVLWTETSLKFLSAWGWVDYDIFEWTVTLHGWIKGDMSGAHSIMQDYSFWLLLKKNYWLNSKEDYVNSPHPYLLQYYYISCVHLYNPEYLFT